MSTIFGYDSDQIEELELKVVNFKALISEEELATAVSAGLMNGFSVTKQDGGHDKPCYIFQKETVFKDVVKNGGQILVDLFPHTVFSKNTLQRLTGNCRGKGLENHACVLGVEVFIKDLETCSYYQAVPMVKIFINAE